MIIILLSLISQRIVYNEVFYPVIDRNIEMHHLILQGNYEPPYQYRVLKPVFTEIFSKMLSPVIQNEVERFKLIHKIMLFIGFYFLYLIFYYFLKNFYSDVTAMTGMLLLQISIPLTMTNSNCFEEGDCITAFFYLMAFYAMFKKKEYLIPLIVGIGTLNREQTVFILVFYAAYLWDRKKLFAKKSIIIMAGGVLAFAAVFAGLRLYFGFMPTRFTSDLHTQINQAGLSSIIRLWTEQILIFIIGSIIVFKKSRLFFKAALLCIIPYTVFFFFFGVMGELGKFLPAMIIMITMSLQFLKKEYTGTNELKHA